MRAALPLELDEPNELEPFFWNSPDFMAVLDARLHIIQNNPAFEKQLGRQVGRSIIETARRCASRSHNVSTAPHAPLTPRWFGPIRPCVGASGW
jgi:hypothetical protein